MNNIRTNKPNFFGNNGEPLQSGYIYIGQPNQDPIEFPKVVTFEDSQGNQSPATQPLRTNAQGQIAYNGKAMIALVDGDYSMLILDSTQTQIVDGHTPLVEPDEASGSGSDLTAYRENSLLLADVKKLAKSPGQTVSSIGSASTTDRAGVDWLVVSPTGSPADDVDIIDFDNGLQGTRIVNNLSVLKSLEEIADAGAAAQTAARANLAIVYTQQIFTSSGTWTKPTGCRFIEVICIGGGAGAGGVTGNASPTTNAASGGGGGGAYAQAIIDVSAVVSEAITIGAGGAGGAASANNGTNGGNTSFASSVIAAGGQGSVGKAAFTSSSGPGGGGGLASSSTGDLVINGGSGGSSLNFETLFQPGEGGGTFYAGRQVGTAATTGNLYGGGGSGTAIISSGNSAGGSGADGLCIVKEYY